MAFLPLIMAVLCPAGDTPYPSRSRPVAKEPGWPPETATSDLVVLRFGGRRIPRSLADLPVREIAGTRGRTSTRRVHAARRVIVVGADADLAAVLTRLLRTERLDVEVGPAAAPVCDGAAARAARPCRHDGFR